MKIQAIELTNFGSYEGVCTFDFMTEDPKRRIVIVGGKNGAGKTTLFTAMQVCLYGHYAFGFKSDGKLYLNEIYRLINNRSKLDETQTASVKISFSDQQARDVDLYTVHRGWTWNDGGVREYFTVTKNGQELDAEQRSNFQNYLLHLIPPDLLRLYFFDGEKIADYFLEEHRGNIRDALMILSGNDTFDVLHDVVKRLINADKSMDQTSAKEYIRKRDAVRELEDRISAAKAESIQLQKQADETEASIEKIKAEYMTSGGISLEEWKELNDKMKQEETVREQLNAERKLLATEILPFIIIGDLVCQVKPQIQREKEYRTVSTLSASLQTEPFLQMLVDELEKMGLDSTKQRSQKISQRISSFFSADQWDAFTPLFGLSEDEEIQILAALNRIGNNTTTMHDCAKRIQKSLAKTKRLRTQLHKSSIENLEEHLRSVAEQNEMYTKTSFYLTQKKLEQQQLEESLEMQSRELKNAQKAFEDELQQQSVQAVSGRILLLLENLHGQIYQKLILRVQEDVNRKLRQMIRKEQFIDDILIDDDFNVHLLRKQNIQTSFLLEQIRKKGAAGLRKTIGSYAVTDLCNLLRTDEQHLQAELETAIQDSYLLPLEINQNKLSNGEKQIFVMSLYWALMQQCQHNLPFIIDTPFARIDTEHRQNITRHFFAELNGQLFVLSTNEELDDHHLTALHNQIANVYLLEYDANKRTIIRKNQYFEGQLWVTN